MQGEIVRYTLVCSKEVRAQGCDKGIKQKSDSEKWYISRFVEEHNHELLMSKFLNSMREVRISIPKIYKSFAVQVGGGLQIGSIY
ncbi:hypothetical protein Ahy_B03g066944 [Arachis hypogaea]|uniref:FAR1 domain-containing protein n=1 Tax=Arachis hypogaea TaxID=3818 RepID=A0A445A599_ARAHY|nr:hypothetical protein Ahy_B03g066944 [Arachis hypogaea]